MDKTRESSLTALLDEILLELNLPLALETRQKLLSYLDLLERWNQVYNLTAIATPYDRMIKHIADSLAVAPYVSGRHWLDVGSGAGLPGIPLALVFPQVHWTLLDKNGKKTRFLVQAKATLALDNVSVVQGEVGTMQGLGDIDNIICRAWTNVPEMIAKTQHLWVAPTGYLWAMKGSVPVEELHKINQPYVVYPLHVPRLAAPRHLIRILMGSV